MKINRLLFLPFLLFSISTAQAQVSFTNQTNLIGNISGFSYEDCAVDMNSDFLDDVVRVTSNMIYIDYQNVNGTFTQVSFPISLTNTPDWSMAAGDIDANGYNDLLMGNGNGVSFVVANVDGTAYTEDIHPEYIFSQRSTFADIDNDGDLDAFVCHDIDQSHPYRNDGNGNMTLDTSLINTADRPGNYAAIWCDYDGDGDSDLYITKCRGGSQSGDINRTNLLYRNNGDGTYTEAGAAANMDDNSQSWATVFEDFDNDGDFDAFIVNHDFTNRLMCNDGSGYFTDTTSSSGIDAYDLGAWENAAADFDNDGNVDILSQLNYSLYMGNGDLTFTPQNVIFNSGGIGDFNDDGFLDVINGSSVYLNDGNSNHYIKVTLAGSQSNLNGIGANIKIYGAWGTQMREIRSTQSFSPMSTLNGHFGIGAATAVDSIVVSWPSGQSSTVTSPGIDMTHHIVEGPSTARANPIASNRLSISPNPAIGRLELNIAGDVLGEIDLSILNNSGQVVLERSYDHANARILDISSLPAGFYVVQVVFDDQKHTRNLVIQ